MKWVLRAKGMIASKSNERKLDNNQNLVNVIEIIIQLSHYVTTTFPPSNCFYFLLFKVTNYMDIYLLYNKCFIDIHDKKEIIYFFQKFKGSLT